MKGYVRQRAKLAPCRFGFGFECVVVLLTLVLSGACGADDDHAAALSVARGGTEYCTAMCSWSRACGVAVSDSCVMACQANSTLPSHARYEFLEITADCLGADVQCSGGSEASWQACYWEASRTIAPNQAAFDACSALGTYFFECGYTESPEVCAGSLMYYDDRALARASSCGNATCGELAACLEKVANQT